MAKSPNKVQNKQKDPMDDKNYKDKKALVGRVRKVVKKSQRKLGDEKFEKELQRTIGFLTELRDKLNQSASNSSKKATGKTAAVKPKAPAKHPAKVAAKTAAKAPAKAPARPTAKLSAAAHVGAKTAKKA